VQLKSRKSLHQRLDGGGGHTDVDATSERPQVPSPTVGSLFADDSRPINIQDDERRHRSHFEYNHAKIPTRSESVASSTYGRVTQDEDISTIMMRGATDIRNAKFENEEQVCDIRPFYSIYL
jgi:hypothetical protein